MTKNDIIKKLENILKVYAELNSSLINSNNYYDVVNKVKKINGKSINELSLDDIVDMSFSDITFIIDKCIYNEKDKKSYLDNFNKYTTIMKTSNDQDIIITACYFFDSLLNEIKSFYKEYNDKNTDKDQYAHEQIEKLEKYIDYFKNDNIEKYTTVFEFEMLKKDLYKFGFSDEEVIDVISFINTININKSKTSNIDVNINKEVAQIIKFYLYDKNLVDIAKTIFNDYIEYDEIKDKVAKFAQIHEVNEINLYNTVNALMILGYYKDNKLDRELLNKLKEDFKENVREDEEDHEMELYEKDIISLKEYKGRKAA